MSNEIRLQTCPYTDEIDEVMSNFDHDIDESVAKELKKQPVFARYAGWNFNGKVWYDRQESTYYCEVWQYHSHVDTVCGSLKGIMDEVSSEYDYD